MDDEAQRVLIALGRLPDRCLSILAEIGVEASFKADLADAIAEVEERPPDLCVILGCDEKALELLRQIRRSPRGAVVPVLAVTAADVLVDEQACLDAGADSVASQAEGADGLIERIEAMLGIGNTVSLPPPPSDTPGEDRGRQRDDVAAAEIADDPISRALAAAGRLASKATMSSPLRAPYAPGANPNLDSVIAAAELRVAPLFERGSLAAPEVAVDLDEVEMGAYLEEPAGLAGGVSVGAGPESASGDREEGSLERVRVWDLIAGILARRASGVLSLVSRGVERRFFAEEGELTMATSSAREDRLIELLHREGRLTESQYQQAAITIGASGRRAGAVLVEKGLIASRELFPLVRHHYEALIYDSFSWTEGAWRFREGRQRVSERILLDLPTAGIIMEGLRSRARLEDLAAIAPPGSRPSRTDEGIRPLQETGLSEHELEVLEWCDGKRDTETIATRFDMPHGELCAILAGLKILGWVSVEGAAGEIARGIGFPEERPDQAASRRDLRVERARVADKLNQVEEGTYFAVMEVPWDASGYEIRKAYRRLRGLYAPERFAVDELADLQVQAEVIRNVLDEAYEILRNSTLRESYRAAHGEGG
jgi:CheY-like chemotaxis protein